MKPVPVIDLSAGPGGLGEGLYSLYQPKLNRSVRSVRLVIDSLGVDFSIDNGIELVKEMSGHSLKFKMYQERQSTLLICFANK